nr:pentatricopeptide repeat-containing protein At5g66520-like [Tanacetum cinerariifolium]
MIETSGFEVSLKCCMRLCTALMDMYCKCGKLDVAEKVVNDMTERDTILGLAIHGEGLCALRLFSKMEMDGDKPDNVTFITVFTACSYSGMEHE